MRFNEKEIKKQIDSLKLFGWISCSLLLGVLVTIQIFFGNQLANFSDIISFIGLTLVFALFISPIGFCLHWIFNIDSHENDIYNIAWGDGKRDTLKNMSYENYKERTRECLCNEPSCAKCLGVNCEDSECKIHTQEAKNLWRKNNKK